MERRRCERFSVPEATVDWESESHPRRSETRFPLLDLSRGGARFLSDAPPRAGARLRLRLHVPHEEEALELHGHVIWALVSTGHTYSVAVEFEPYGDGPRANPPEVLERLIALEARFLAPSS